MTEQMNGKAIRIDSIVLSRWCMAISVLLNEEELPDDLKRFGVWYKVQAKEVTRLVSRQLQDYHNCFHTVLKISNDMASERDEDFQEAMEKLESMVHQNECPESVYKNICDFMMEVRENMAQFSSQVGDRKLQLIEIREDDSVVFYVR